MMNKIANELTAQSRQEDCFSENGARMHASTGRALLDCNFKVASYRGASVNTIINDFTKAWVEDPELAIKWLFFVRDVREGLGERRLFRTILPKILSMDSRVEKLLQYVGEYGRWDDLFEVYQLSPKTVEKIVQDQLADDMLNMSKKKPISILAKWMPSVNTSSKAKRNLGRKLAKNLSMTEKEYRKALSALRKYLDVTEVKTSTGKWDEIDYQKVPSQANLKYRNAFLKHDETRRREFLGKLEKGEVKINSSVTFPHDIVHQYAGYSTTKDAAIEGMWKNLPSYGIEDTLVVADGSGSMTSNIPNTNVTALEVANALAIYCSQNNKGEFKDKYITFSSRPQLVNLSKCDGSLYARLQIAHNYNEVSNTDIYKVFKLILDTATKNKMHQDEMAKNILVISDMEFDSGTDNANSKLFDQITKEYDAAGYKIPRCIYWNVNSRTGAIPMVENELGVTLVSGFSINIAKMIMSNKLDPFECLKDTLLSERYRVIKL